MVKATDSQSGYITVSIGSDAGLSKGDTLEVYRLKPEAAYLGKRVMMHWPTQKFMLGSYTCPLVGQFTGMLENCATAELEGRLLFAGEHTSADFHEGVSAFMAKRKPKWTGRCCGCAVTVMSGASTPLRTRHECAHYSHRWPQRGRG